MVLYRIIINWLSSSKFVSYFAGSFEHGNKILVFIKGGEFLD